MIDLIHICETGEEFLYSNYRPVIIINDCQARLTLGEVMNLKLIPESKDYFTGDDLVTIEPIIIYVRGIFVHLSNTLYISD